MACVCKKLGKYQKKRGEMEGPVDIECPKYVDQLKSLNLISSILTSLKIPLSPHYVLSFTKQGRHRG